MDTCIQRRSASAGNPRSGRAKASIGWVRAAGVRHRGLGLALALALAIGGSSLPLGGDPASAQTDLGGDPTFPHDGGEWVEVCELSHLQGSGDDNDSPFHHECYWIQI